jgi:heme/copper-type cytochrome/quinol oxidase subunit 3
MTEGKKKAKSHSQAQNKSRCKTEVFFMVPYYLFGTALTCYFGTSMLCAKQPWGSSLCGLHVAFHMLRLLDDKPNIKKAAVIR